jgi:hypothetical protein
MKLNELSKIPSLKPDKFVNAGKEQMVMVVITAPEANPIDALLKHVGNSFLYDNHLIDEDDIDPNRVSSYDWFAAQRGLLTKTGDIVQSAAKKDIDWDRVLELAKIKTSGVRELYPNDPIMISGKEKKYAAPMAFIDKNGDVFIEDEMIIAPHSKDTLKNSRFLYHEKWFAAVEAAHPDDIFSHWNLNFG